MSKVKCPVVCAEAQEAELDRLCRSLEEKVRATEELTDRAWRLLATPHIEDPLPQKESPKTLTVFLSRVIDWLAYTNESLEILLNELERKVGELKILDY